MSPSSLRIRRHPGRFWLSASLALLCGAVATSSAIGAQYGRSTVTGDWGDGGWIDSGGVTGGTPGVTDEAGIGAFFAPLAQQTATVSVSGDHAASSVYVGVGAGMNGTLTIESTGALAAAWLQLGSTDGVGSLEVKPGGVLDVGTFHVDSSTGGATINLHGQTMTMEGYIQFGPGAPNRGVGDALSAKQFAFFSTSYDFDGVDSFTHGGVVGAGAIMSNSAALSLLEGLQVSSTGAAYVVNAPLSMAGNLTVTSGATLDVNDDVTLTATGYYWYSPTNLIENATLNLNQGTLTAKRLAIAGTSTVSRASGHYALEWLDLTGTALTLEADDDVTHAISLSGGATLDLEKSVSLVDYLPSTLVIDNSTLNLQGHVLEAPSVFLSGTTTINRGAGGVIQGKRFTISGAGTTYDYAEDSFTESGIVNGGGTMNQQAALTLTGSLNVSGPGSTYNVQAPLQVGSLALLSEGALTVDETTLIVDNLFGLQISADALLTLLFAPTSSPGLNWALRLTGDNEAALQGMLGSQIVANGAPQAVEVIRDVALYGDYTFVGYVAIPEPAAASLLAIGTAGALMGRRRRSCR